MISISTFARLLLALAPPVAVVTGSGEIPFGTPAAQAQPARSSGIELPEMLAIELPAPGMTSIGPGASPLKELLESALAPGRQVAHDVRSPLPLGATQVTWTAWSGAPGTSQTVSTRQAWVYVFPFGQTPAGISGRHDATAGNHSAKVVRDRSGRVHATWLDAARPGKGTTVLYRSGVQDPTTGRFTWDTPVSPITAPGAAVGMGAMEVSLNAVHFAWATESTTRYLRVLRVGSVLRSDPIRDTRAAGSAYDNGSDLAVRGDDEIHVLTYAGQYAVSTNGGATWRVEQVPWPAGEKKNPALAVDAMGNAHVVYVLKVRIPAEWKSGQPNGAYWQLRYVRRQAQGGWVDAQDVLGAFPEWRDQGMSRDVLADWPDIAADAQGNIHVGFHGTANSGKYGQDEAFYVRRPAAGPGAWSAWEHPVPLHPVNRATRRSSSYAPSLALDPETDTVVAVVFFDYQDQSHEAYDSDALLLRGGKIVGAPIMLSRNARTAIDAKRADDALASWFPTAAPRLYRPADGRVWLDVLYTAQTPERHGSPHYVIYHRRELTNLLKAGTQ
ncbi:MAG: hypothetical protein Q7W02_16030 [Candidatus Rokubacteria bacterium]|nr:hypothetical protein [Candidatus Rokubacteria bacterium]